MQCKESTSSTIFAALLNSDSPTNIADSRIALPYSQESEEIIQCAWKRSELTSFEFAIYAFVVPVLAFFGFFANFINFMVFMRPKMTPSAFSYLAALSWLDCISCLLITLTSISRSFLYQSTFWLVYDFQWQTPLFSITTGAANLILACVSSDRFIYLRWGIPNGTPKFCKRAVARRMIVTVTLLSILVNLPYFWVFVVNDDGTFATTEFYFSRCYEILNWLTFVLLTLLPAIFLMVGNAAILIAFCKWAKQSKKCQTSCPNSKYKNSQVRYKHQMKLTVTIVIVITLYLVGELPAHLTSRKSVVNLLYGGDVNKVNFHSMQRLEVICITLNSIQLSMNMIVYAVINPCYVPEFFNCLKDASNACSRCMRFLTLAKYWRKTCHSIEDKDEHSNSENVDGQKNYTVENMLEVTSNCPAKKQKLDIAVICTKSYSQSFDNPIFRTEEIR